VIRRFGENRRSQERGMTDPYWIKVGKEAEAVMNSYWRYRAREAAKERYKFECLARARAAKKRQARRNRKAS
jgi:hypothetical protein